MNQLWPSIGQGYHESKRRSTSRTLGGEQPFHTVPCVDNCIHFFPPFIPPPNLVLSQDWRERKISGQWITEAISYWLVISEHDGTNWNRRCTITLAPRFTYWFHQRIRGIVHPMGPIRSITWHVPPTCQWQTSSFDSIEMSSTTSANVNGNRPTHKTAGRKRRRGLSRPPASDYETLVVVSKSDKSQFNVDA
jgi:hypothetical protein